MLTAIKTGTGETSSVRLVGILDENANLAELLGVPSKVLTVNCREIARINSIGVRNWIQHFQSAQFKGTSLTFQECSPAVVSQLSAISGFACSGKVESVCLPYLCSDCGHEAQFIHSSEELRSFRSNIPPETCPKCGGTACFDDIAEEFCRFLDDL